MASVDPLFDEWETYEKVVRHDYMHQRKFFDHLRKHLTIDPSQSLSILDLGCGDALAIESFLQAGDVTRYVGIDQSTIALEKAKRRLDSLEIPCELHTGEMLEVLGGLEGAFDLIVASYSLHHLPSADKTRVLQHCQRLTDSEGMVVVIDVFLRPDEQRKDFLVRWEANARTHFDQLSPTELEFLLAHVKAQDYPENPAGFANLARGVDLTAHELMVDGPEINRLVLLRPEQPT